MKTDAFSRCHPAVNFVYFALAIAFGVVIQHPAYMLAAVIGASVYYLLLKGGKGIKSYGSPCREMIIPLRIEFVYFCFKFIKKD